MSKDEHKWGLAGEHPCTRNAKHGTVFKFEVDGEKVYVYESHPNGCGYVGARGGGIEDTILVGISTFDRQGHIEHHTDRIAMSHWNALNFVECCADPDTKKWRTNVPNLPEQ
jgi:hypothetical protein